MPSFENLFIALSLVEVLTIVSHLKANKLISTQNKELARNKKEIEECNKLINDLSKEELPEHFSVPQLSKLSGVPSSTLYKLLPNLNKIEVINHQKMVFESDLEIIEDAEIKLKLQNIFKSRCSG